MKIRNRQTIILLLLASSVIVAVTYGVVTYQTPYGCGPDGVASGPAIDWHVLAKPCIYIYFIGIVGGSAIVILLIPVPKTKTEVQSVTQKEIFSEWWGWPDLNRRFRGLPASY